MEFESKQILNYLLCCISKLTTKCSKASPQIDSQLYYSVICNKCMIFIVNPVLHKPNYFKKKKCKYKNLKHYTSISDLLHQFVKFKSFCERKKLRTPTLRSLKVLSIRHCSLERIQNRRLLLLLRDRRKNIGNFKVS